MFSLVPLLVTDDQMNDDHRQQTRIQSYDQYNHKQKQTIGRLRPRITRSYSATVIVTRRGAGSKEEKKCFGMLLQYETNVIQYT